MTPRSTTFLLLSLMQGAHGAFLASTVCEDLWPERNPVHGGDALCYASIDASDPSDTVEFLKPSCTDNEMHAWECSVSSCVGTGMAGRVNCSIGGQRRGFELPAGWEIASAFSPDDTLRGSLAAIIFLATTYTFSTTFLQMRDSIVITVGYSYVHDGASTGVIGDVTKNTAPEYSWLDHEHAAGGYDGWNPWQASLPENAKTSKKLLIRTCPRGTYMPAFVDATLAHNDVTPSACMTCNATTGCVSTDDSYECHTIVSDGWWDGAGSTGCAAFATPRHEDPCFSLYGAAIPSPSTHYASYSALDGHCYRVLDEGVEPSSTVIGTAAPVHDIPPGFEIVDLSKYDAKTNLTRRAAQRMAWLESFGTYANLMMIFMNLFIVRHGSTYDVVSLNRIDSVLLSFFSNEWQARGRL